MRKPLQHLNYANVMASIAVFLALGGTVYAAKKIGSKQIKANAILEKHIRGGAVGGDQIKDGAVSAIEVLDESLGGADIGPGAVGTSELATGTATGSKLSCPARSSFTRLGEICVNPPGLIGFSNDFTSAVQQCSSSDLRLPTTGEAAIILRHVSDANPALNETWTSTLFGATSAFLVNEPTPGALTYLSRTFTENHRFFCVTTLG